MFETRARVQEIFILDNDVKLSIVCSRHQKTALSFRLRCTNPQEHFVLGEVENWEGVQALCISPLKDLMKITEFEVNSKGRTKWIIGNSNRQRA